MIFKKYREIIVYVFFGGLTTLCNIFVYWICAHPLNIDEITSTIIAFVVSVIFAFATNRIWVFHSGARGIKEIAYELCRFFGARLFSGGLDVLIIFVFVTHMGFNDMIIKLLSNVMVVILNYIFSKLFVFKKK